MPRIQQLPPLVVSKIAAGEVIERPASVVKELLENSIDAGATRIDLEIEQGGLDLIRVVDDGCGIVAEDLPVAFARHATSKLRDADDLFKVETLGFRGEALASIGGVAQVKLQSRPRDAASGNEISCAGSELTAVRPWNGAPGTRLEVRHLFFNTPARRKFMRTTATEAGHITEMMTRIALGRARPTLPTGLHLTLRNNVKTTLDIPGSANLLDRIGRLFEHEVANQLYFVEARQPPAGLTGYIGDPACNRGTPRMQYLFLNGRWIRDRSLAHAVQEAYRGLLMTGRYPVAFLFLELPPELVDVNVHPNKSEVRFRDSQALHHLIFTAIRERLRRENLTARLHAPSSLQPTAQPIAEQSDRTGSYEVADPEAWQLASDAPIAPTLPFALPRPVVRLPEQMPHTGTESPPSNKIIQLYDSYLVVETERGMLVIDQHALHERILFEQFKHRLREGALEQQQLLVPETVELSAEQAARTLEAKEELAQLGLQIEAFGGNTLLLTSYPALLGGRNPQKVLRAVIDHLMTNDRLPAREVLFNNLLSLMACHSAVRAGDRLTPEEMADLVAQRALADDTHHCPHGRPTALLFSKQDLERQFGRI